MPQILIFGDSITHGAWDIMRGGVGRLVEKFLYGKRVKKSRIRLFGL